MAEVIPHQGRKRSNSFQRMLELEKKLMVSSHHFLSYTVCIIRKRDKLIKLSWLVSTFSRLLTVHPGWFTSSQSWNPASSLRVGTKRRQESSPTSAKLRGCATSAFLYAHEPCEDRIAKVAAKKASRAGLKKSLNDFGQVREARTQDGCLHTPPRGRRGALCVSVSNLGGVRSPQEGEEGGEEGREERKGAGLARSSGSKRTGSTRSSSRERTGDARGPGYEGESQRCPQASRQASQ